MSDALVSVVITTRNEAAHIGNCLESIKRQSYCPIEIIVVDNESTDDTIEIASRYTEHIFRKGPERSAQRNFGMLEKAKGAYILFLDADMILARTLIEHAVNRSAKEDITAFYIPEVILGSSFLSQVRRFERSFYDGTPIDCVRFITKAALHEVGGFDLSMTGPEDWDFDKRVRARYTAAILGSYSFAEIHSLLSDDTELGTELVAKLQSSTDSPVIFHNERAFNLKSYLEKKRYYAGSFDTYRAKWPSNDPDIKKQFGFFYRFIGVFVEEGRIGRLLRHPLLALGMYYLRFRVGSQYLSAKGSR